MRRACWASCRGASTWCIPVCALRDRALGAASAFPPRRCAFAPLTPRDEIHAYWASGEPQGKAGAYAIQGLGAVFVANIAGSYTGVMGLPLFETAQMLRSAGIPVWRWHCLSLRGNG